MKERRMDKVARMERARARAVRRKVLGALKWAAVGTAAWAVSAALHRRAAGGLGRFDAAAIFVSLVALWAILEALARELAGAAREWMRTRTRERVLERRSRQPFRRSAPPHLRPKSRPFGAVGLRNAPAGAAPRGRLIGITCDDKEGEKL